VTQEFLAFNRGLISRLALARTDLKRTAISAAVMKNWMPRALGSMMLRPGLKYIGQTYPLPLGKAKLIDFVFSADDTALIEVDESQIRVFIDDVLLSRPTVSASVTNGSFNLNVTGWTDADEGAASSVHVSTGVSSGYLGMTGTGTDAAIRRQQVAVTETGVEHALAIKVIRNPVRFRVGSTAGGEEYITDMELGVGHHDISFTPAGDFHIQFLNREKWTSGVDSCQIAYGDVYVPSPWLDEHLSLLRWTQSGDVIFVACEGNIYEPHRIERHNTRSWSVVEYRTKNGPFRLENTTETTITTSALSGSVTLTASAPIFKSTNVGSLYRVESNGQRVEKSFTSDSQESGHIRVFGTGASREFAVIVEGSFSMTITLQKSVGEPGDWADGSTTYTAAGNYTVEDELDNQEMYYRFVVKAGNYTSGTANITIIYAGGSIAGVARVTAYTDEETVTADVLQDFGGLEATKKWREGAWSDRRGFPSAVALYEGRLWWAGKDNFWGSVTDDFANFDPDTEGDSGPISRTIGYGPVDNINWMVPAYRLLAGTDGSVVSCRSSSLDEILTPTNFNVKEVANQAAERILAIKVDGNPVYVQRGGYKVFELDYDVKFNNYAASDLTAVVPEIGAPGIVAIGAQRQPDTRIHCVRSDGSVAVLVFDRQENVQCWVEVETDGAVEDVCVLPGTNEDSVYYVVKRTIEGEDRRYIEKWALESECAGGTLNKQADSFATFTNSPAAASVPAGTASHLVGEQVVVWADGKCLTDADGDVALFTVAADGGIAALTNGGASYTATTGVVGLPYTAQFKSTKLAYMVPQGASGLGAKKMLGWLSLVLADTHHKGLKYGRDFDSLDDLPQVVEGATVAVDTVWTDEELEPFTLPGEWETDARLCLQAEAPRPCTVLAAILGEKINPR
jgi:hypothetical protein